MKTWLENYLTTLDGKRITRRAAQEEEEYINYPVPSVRFNAYNIKEEDIKVVLTYPYPDARNPLFSNGYAWSNSQDIATNEGRRLINRIERDYQDQITVKEDYDFSRWSSQGVFLPHQFLTTRWNTNEPNKNIRWDKMFWSALEYLIKQPQPRSFIIVYKESGGGRQFRVLNNINKEYHNHLLIPSRSDAGFSSQYNYFYSANKYLERNNITGINWEK